MLASIVTRLCVVGRSSHHSSVLIHRNVCSLFQATRKTYCSAPEKDVLCGMPVKHPEKGDLVYGGPLGKLMKRVKLFSLTTSAIGLSLQPYIIMHSQTTSYVAKMAVGVTVSFFVFVTPLLIHWITKKYVTDLYYNKDTDEFTAATISLFLRRAELRFKPEDVQTPDIPGMFTSLVIKGKPLFMDSSMFYSRDAYVKLMGYDKPLDWELPDPSLDNEADKKQS